MGGAGGDEIVLHVVATYAEHLSHISIDNSLTNGIVKLETERLRTTLLRRQGGTKERGVRRVLMPLLNGPAQARRNLTSDNTNSQRSQSRQWLKVTSLYTTATRGAGPTRGTRRGTSFPKGPVLSSLLQNWGGRSVADFFRWERAPALRKDRRSKPKTPLESTQTKNEAVISLIRLGLQAESRHITHKYACYASFGGGEDGGRGSLSKALRLFRLLLRSRWSELRQGSFRAVAEKN